MFKALARVLGGFGLACLAAGLVKVLFVMTPVQLAGIPNSAFPTTAGDMSVLVLLAATHTAIFSATFAFVATGVGEWLSLRSPLYYVTGGAVIAILGFFAQYSSEAGGQPTIFNAYALAAFLTAGVIAGLVYWGAAGKHAGPGAADANTGAAALTKSRPRIIVEKSPSEGDAQRRSWATRAKAARAMVAENAGETSTPAGPAAPSAGAAPQAAQPSKAKPADLLPQFPQPSPQLTNLCRTSLKPKHDRPS